MKRSIERIPGGTGARLNAGGATNEGARASLRRASFLGPTHLHERAASPSCGFRSIAVLFAGVDAGSASPGIDEAARFDGTERPGS
jgi:hypothetical protein